MEWISEDAGVMICQTMKEELWAFKKEGILFKLGKKADISYTFDNAEYIFAPIGTFYPEYEIPSELERFSVSPGGTYAVFCGFVSNTNWLCIGILEDTDMSKKVFEISRIYQGRALEKEANDKIIQIKWVSENFPYFCVLTKGGIWSMYDARWPYYPLYDYNLGFKRIPWFPSDFGIGRFVDFNIFLYAQVDLISVLLLRDDGDLFLLSSMELMDGRDFRSTLNNFENFHNRLPRSLAHLQEFRCTGSETRLPKAAASAGVDGYKDLRPILQKLEKKRNFDFDTNYNSISARATKEHLAIFTSSTSGYLDINIISKATLKKMLFLKAGEKGNKKNLIVYNYRMNFRNWFGSFSSVKFLKHDELETKVTLALDECKYISSWFSQLKYVMREEPLLKKLKNKLKYQSYLYDSNGPSDRNSFLLLSNGVPCVAKFEDNLKIRIYYQNIYNEIVDRRRRREDWKCGQRMGREELVSYDQGEIDEEKSALENLRDLYATDEVCFPNRLGKLKEILLKSKEKEEQEEQEEEEEDEEQTEKWVLEQRINIISENLMNKIISKNKEKLKGEIETQEADSDDSSEISFSIIENIKSKVLQDIECIEEKKENYYTQYNFFRNGI